ncbi:NDP-sugar pyrophosphorylase family protein [Bradyrhizobium japonicum]|jgi:NDP-sugar pyrophosphorylase family protein|uniref:NDP-sugar pyrophosphorylase family protein n=1 Tax=Bradyrhizobium elkanii TaxID=29448 RepID=A0ABV4FEQ9_BRAEL|nr:sugar phosphate nucleotidyltransferase [Bradyrhizobium elkanii]MBP2431535.1 NDP-sugar pyrophosphorylase family protein [Bradyrhizobium elkanii]MCP1734829.1 NDP-sugar pyrophosphorylase family protein [Bradyrhizobium elkanii]MCP1752936.1 NDP-sugar pyrophosphorylase family protein [Bradyrhizobium elkanii]MCP1975316.1 NDP-sugar pyrophosphorylase family protein [Bradyrhizobium elkanii]MCS3522433.1 NDP-sugar pyrophosphorylase family protein [Bradyrhizobium elkanii]
MTKALIMAGGKGTRLKPFTASFPKPLVPLGDLPVLELLLRQLKAAGVQEVVLSVNHLHHLIRAFCEDGSKFGLKIDYVLEDEPLGTAGSLAYALDKLSDDFIVANGDLLTNFNIAKMVQEHRTQPTAASIAVFKRSTKIEFGLVEVDGNMRLTGYREKPTYSHLVSMGLYVLNRGSVAPHLVPGKYLDMPHLMQILIEAGKSVLCRSQDCLWLDIGRPEDYATAQQLFEEKRELFLQSER